MIFDVPNVGRIELKTIVLDLNGVLSVKGEVPPGVKSRINQLKKLKYNLVLLSGDVRGTAKKIAQMLGIKVIICQNAAEKKKAIKKLHPSTCAAIGNARIDIYTLKLARVSLLTLQAEGIHAETIKHADLIVPSINDALDLLMDKLSFSATMKK